MARLNFAISCDSDDEDFPDLSKILKRSDGKEMDEWGGKVVEGEKEKKQEQGRKTVQHGITGSPKSVTKVSCDEKPLRKQRLLGFAHINSLRLPIEKESVQKKFDRNQHLDFRHDEMIRTTPRRAAKDRMDPCTFSLSTSGAIVSEDDVFFDDLSDFIVDDSASDVEEPPSRTQKPRREVVPDGKKVRSIEPTVVDLTSPKKSLRTPSGKPSKVKNISQKSETVFDEDPESCLRFSPPRSRSVHKSADKTRPTTPPSSPSKPRLHFPSKKIRIPSSPHRPSIDAFWSQEVINDWNDEHSPRKTPHTERFRRTIISISEDEDESEPHSPSSPRRTPIKKSPVKKDKEEIQRRKLFDEKKCALATSFLKDVDEKTANGRIAALAASAGGIQIVWSKKLRSTAGRANWKRETLRAKNADGTVSATTYRHHASIELAEKIIDDEDRLFNTIAHEYCHLANFMISGIKNNPHGKEFKQWAHKVTTNFSHLAIHVTTKHSYAIAYKYIWTCSSSSNPAANPGCGQEYKRHSRSIDPKRHRCGKCRGLLIQVKPIPRAGGAGAGASVGKEKGVAAGAGAGAGAGKGKEGGGGKSYQEYVREHFGRVRAENPTLGMAGWMVELGRAFREERARGLELGVPAGGTGGGISISGGGGGNGGGGGGGGGVDEVARKLDFLSL